MRLPVVHRLQRLKKKSPLLEKCICLDSARQEFLHPYLSKYGMSYAQTTYFNPLAAGVAGITPIVIKNHSGS